MKRIIIVLLLIFYMANHAAAQTKPHWLQIQGAPLKDVRSYGVKGDGTTDDYAALKNAFEAGGIVVIPSGLVILVDAPDAGSNQISITADTRIINLGSIILQDDSGSNFANNILGFTFGSEIPAVGGRTNLMFSKYSYGYVGLASATAATITSYIGFAPPTLGLASYTWQAVTP